MVAPQERQKRHYDKITSRYAQHYNDKYSQIYREEFINKPLLKGIELTGRKVLDLMCGSGGLARFLLKRNAIVTGLDISGEQIEFFRKESGGDYICSSIFENEIADNSFDCVVVVSGLHHLHPRVNEAVEEIYRILKPSAYFCFYEPYAGSLPDFFRRLWYKIDRLVENNEAAIDLCKLKRDFSNKFEFLSQAYAGGPAYLFVFNSMMFRIPLPVKNLISMFFLRMEKAFCSSGNKRISFVSINQWRKKPAGVG